MATTDFLQDKMQVAPLKLIVHKSCEQLGDEVNAYLVEYRKQINHEYKSQPEYFGYERDTYLGAVTCPRFGSGEGKAEIIDSVRGNDVFIMADVMNHSLSFPIGPYEHFMSPDDIYMDVKRIIAAMAGRAHRITVILPFLYESRQHKRNTRESLDCANALVELYSMGVNNVVTFDAHDPKVQNATPLRGFDNFIPPYQFIQALTSVEDDLVIDKDHLLVISPDEGALDRAVYFAGVLGVNTGTFYKRRDYAHVVNGKNPIVAHEFLGDNVEGKDIIIIDDMISSGGSMIDTAKKLKEMNAGRVFICCTFGLFTEGVSIFDEAYEKGYFDQIIVTNLNYHTPEINDRPYFIEANMSKFLASIIDFLNHDVALSSVHTPTAKIKQILEKYDNKE